MIFLWGVAGAFIYATQSLILRLWDHGETWSGRSKALAEYALALATGGLFALGGAAVVQRVLHAGVTVNGMTLKAEVEIIPVALTVGWAANYLWPKILRKLGQAVDASSERSRA